MISAEYLSQLKELHQKKASFGIAGEKWFKSVIDLAAQYKCTGILDYGCGKGSLIRKLSETIKGIELQNYDPAINEYSHSPDVTDMITWIDVAEHIEPEHLGDVLTHIAYLTKKVLFAVISTRSARKTLPDGRNAHLIVRSPGWWIDMINLNMNVVLCQINNDEIVIIAKPKVFNKEKISGTV
jgi:hypothetical protein